MSPFALALASLLAAGAAAAPPFIPLYYPYGGAAKVSTDLHWGTPSQLTIPTIFDLGSANFWVYGAKNIMNFGGRGIGEMGPCNQTARPAFDWHSSKTSTEPQEKQGIYAYGGLSKFIYSYFTLNDTMSFGLPNVPDFKNVQVAVSNWTMNRMPIDPSCPKVKDYDRSILGVSEYIGYGDYPLKTQGPSFKQNLLRQGLIESKTLSMWFDKQPDTSSANANFYGTALFGAIPKSKYTGPLVKVKPNHAKGYWIGYWVNPPKFAAAALDAPNKKQPVKQFNKVERCMIDSGASTDSLPVSSKSLLNITGLIQYKGYTAYDGPCDAIPRNATLDYTFTGLESKKVTVKVPLRNYARGAMEAYGGSSPQNKCALSLSLDHESDCILGAPFTSAAFLAFNDEKNQIAIAQGGVSEGAQSGSKGLGGVEIIHRGQGLP